MCKLRLTILRPPEDESGDMFEVEDKAQDWRARKEERCFQETEEPKRAGMRGLKEAVNVWR